MEEFIFNKIVKLAASEECNKVIGKYLPTPKNVLVKNLYKNYGFTNDSNKWVLDIKNYQVKKTFIQEK